MADFFQTGCVTTLHQLGDAAPRIERELESFASSTSAGLALPALYTEFEHPAMRGIVGELREARFLRRIVVALGRAGHDQYRHARSFFDGFDTPVSFLQVDHPRISSLLRMLERSGLPMGAPGKGRACWLAAGYLLARGGADLIAFHDCDIRNYRRGLLARLCYPLMHPALGFDYAKGYYARVSDQLHGRVTRLFFTPLVRALRAAAPDAPFLDYLDTFRYALSGEFALRDSLALRCSIPAGWALEIGMLTEAFDLSGPSRVCQIDIAANYEHKHQPLSPSDSSRGLRRMSLEIAQALLRAAAAHGFPLGADGLRSLEARYAHLARQAVRCYEADALCNGLHYDLHAELGAVQAFSHSLAEAAAAVLADPLGPSPLPSWALVRSAVPRFFDLLLDAVAETDPLRPVLVPAWGLPHAAPVIAGGLGPAASIGSLRHQLQ